MYQGTPLILRPEALEAAKTGKRVVTEFKRYGERFAWVFYPNGLQVMLLLRKLPYVRIRVSLRTGALDDTIFGELHALEHLLAKDVLEENVHPILRHLLPYGLETNASTSYEDISLYGRSIYRTWRDLLRGLLTMALHPCTLDQTRWDKERPAIEQEIRSMTENIRVDNAIRAALNPNIKRLHSRPFGTLNSVAELNDGTLKTRFEQDFSIDRTLIIFQGIPKAETALTALDEWLSEQSFAHRSSRPLRAPYRGDGVRLENHEVRVRESIGSERVQFMARLPLSTPSTTLEAASVLIKTLHEGGLLHDEFRRVRGLTYSQGASLQREHGGTHLLTAYAKMRAANHQEANAAFSQLWKQACASLLEPGGRANLSFSAAQGKHILDRTDDKLERDVNYGHFLSWLWLEQALPQHRPFIDVPPEEFPAIACHAPELADLEWHMISVVRDI